ncbi:hypothetical protein PAXRUDRAFT_824218 [Paxillus rubicundulus Ve08.2h10]|uniref:Uncharacterized protein n=1 Tax=Paxillus rubicundulus Ve08.2h10 TaxID=930991 RepID=A0A0D0DIH5_9AGAM|nr:hypothetical protein PAXRUDRAFT_824218 [Paxillus rubicundulus Ve08.2h10]
MATPKNPGSSESRHDPKVVSHPPWWVSFFRVTAFKAVVTFRLSLGISPNAEIW